MHSARAMLEPVFIDTGYVLALVGGRCNLFGHGGSWRVRCWVPASRLGWEPIEFRDQPNDEGRDEPDEKAPGVAGAGRWPAGAGPVDASYHPWPGFRLPGRNDGGI